MIDSERIKSFVEGRNLFGYRFVKNKDYEDAYNSSAERLKLINEKTELSHHVSNLDSEVESLKKGNKRLPFSIKIGDPTPQKASERKTYVAEVAGFHKNNLHEKLMYMIHSIHVLFEVEDNDRDQDLMLKGAIYGFRELDRWGNMMISEQMSNESGGVGSPDDEKLKEINE